MKRLISLTFTHSITSLVSSLPQVRATTAKLTPAYPALTLNLRIGSPNVTLLLSKIAKRSAHYLWTDIFTETSGLAA